MKKITVLLLFLFFIITFSNAQVFNTAQTLKKGIFSVGIEPMLIANGTDFTMYFHGGYGLTNGVDLAVKFSAFSPVNYVGADVEFNLSKYFSLSTGAHFWGDFGLDGTLLGTLPVKKGINFYSGFDTDMNFGSSVYLNFWIPVGFEIQIKKKMSFILEASIGLNNTANHYIGGGLNFYF
jgi:hypothetical protein